MSRDRWHYLNRFRGRWDDEGWLTDEEVGVDDDREYTTWIDLPSLKIIEANFFDSLHVYVREDLIDVER